MSSRHQSDITHVCNPITDRSVSGGRSPAYLTVYREGKM